MNTTTVINVVLTEVVAGNPAPDSREIGDAKVAVAEQANGAAQDVPHSVVAHPIAVSV